MGGQVNKTPAYVRNPEQLATALVGALKGLGYNVEVSRKPINPSLTAPRVREIQEAVCARLDVSMAELMSARRLKRTVKARHLAMWLAVECTGASLPTLAKLFNRADHTTVMHGIDQAAKRIASNPAERELAHELRAKFRRMPV